MLKAGSCMSPCPGDPSESCGGSTTTLEARKLHKKHHGPKKHNYQHPRTQPTKRQNAPFLLTVYGNDDPFNAAPSSEVEVHFAPTTGGLPIPTTSVEPLGSVLGVGMGGAETRVYFVPTSEELLTPSTSLPPASSALGVGMGGAESGVHFAPTGGELPTPSTSLPPASSAFGIGKGGGNAGATYTTVLTSKTPLPPLLRCPEDRLTNGIAQYVDLCSCTASTLQTYTITSTLTRTHCGCTDSPLAAPTSTKIEIPMTTQIKTCDVCGPNGNSATLTLTLPAADTYLLAPQTQLIAIATAAALISEQAAGVVVASETQPAVRTVTVIPQAQIQAPAVATAAAYVSEDAASVMVANQAQASVQTVVVVPQAYVPVNGSGGGSYTLVTSGGSAMEDLKVVICVVLGFAGFVGLLL